eukprot:jgi/Mesvir1/1934/Mv22959-RA.1
MERECTKPARRRITDYGDADVQAGDSRGRDAPAIMSPHAMSSHVFDGYDSDMRFYSSSFSLWMPTSDSKSVFLLQNFVLRVEARKSQVKKAGGGSNSSSHSSSGGSKGHAPERITTDLRAQIRALKLLKELDGPRSPGKPLAPTAFRKRKRPTSAGPTDDVTGTDTDGEKVAQGGSSAPAPLQAAPPGVVIVDGYNICGAWARIKKHFDRRADPEELERARTMLTDDLTEYSYLRGVKVVLVFDSSMASEAGDIETTPQGIDVVYAANADGWIEAEVLQRKQEGQSTACVASSDNTLRIAVANAAGHVMSANNLIQEIKKAKKENEERLRGMQPHSRKGKRIQDQLDEDVAADLRDLRSQLNDLQKGNFRPRVSAKGGRLHEEDGYSEDDNDDVT